jgi:hypothetical protein
VELVYGFNFQGSQEGSENIKVKAKLHGPKLVGNEWTELTAYSNGGACGAEPDVFCLIKSRQGAPLRPLSIFRTY